MSEKMTLTFHSPILEEAERTGLLSEGLEQRKEAFKDDEELMKETTRFVADVIETATTEVSRRKYNQQTEFQTDEGSSLRGGDRVRGWNTRARGFCNRILNAVCPCIMANEFISWASYRFTRP